MSETVQLELPFDQAPPLEQPDNPLASKRICLSVRFRRPGTRRTVSTEQVEVETDKRMLHVAKDILHSPELLEIKRHDIRTWGLIRSFALPYPLAPGYHLIPLPLVKQVDELLEGMNGKRKALIEAFLLVYPEQVEAAQERLKTLFSAGDYPPVEQLEQQFRVEVRYLNFGLPGTLKEVNQQLFEREKEKFSQHFDELLTQVEQGLWTELKRLVDHLSEKLQPDAEGNPRRFEKSTVENLRFFLDVFDAKNIANDQALADVVQDLKHILRGVSPDQLRKNAGLRGQVLQGLADRIQPRLETTAEGRRYTLD